MNPVVLTPIPDQLVIECTERTIHLSKKRQKEIEDFWFIVNQDQSYQRGEVFTVDSILQEKRLCRVLLNKTDYAHYLHTVRNHINDVEACKVIYGAGLVETKDGKYLFGEMGNHTAYAGRLQCVGGGLNKDDKKGKIFDTRQSVLRELAEEFGILSNDRVKACLPKFIKTGGPYNFIVVLYHIQLQETAKEFFKQYDAFAKSLEAKGEQPEFHDIICIDNQSKTVLGFFERDTRQKVDYLKPFLEKMTGLH